MSSAISSRFTAVVGLEVHVQLNLLESKLFSRATGARPGQLARVNTTVSAFDASFPGTYPQLNNEAVAQAIRTALALKARISKRSTFDRKHYYYYDLPLGYQITQQRMPLATGGYLTLSQSGKRLRLSRVQLEQDSGRIMKTNRWTRELNSLRNSCASTLVDLNRSGVALVELVFEPDLRTPEEAGDALRTLISLLRHIGVCDGDMEKGSIRADLNISLVRSSSLPNSGSTNDITEKVKLLGGQRVEIKNMNSVRYLEQATAYEIKRQASLISVGSQDRVVKSETRGFDPKSKRTYRQRSKADNIDYRFIPEPDLGTLVVSAHDIAKVVATLPELPEKMMERLTGSRASEHIYDDHDDGVTYGLSNYNARVLMSDPKAVQLFEDTVNYRRERLVSGEINLNDQLYRMNPEPNLVAKWITNDLFGAMRQHGIESTSSLPITAQHLSELILLIQHDIITAASAKRVLTVILDEGLGMQNCSPKEEPTPPMKIKNPYLVNMLL